MLVLFALAALALVTCAPCRAGVGEECPCQDGADGDADADEAIGSSCSPPCGPGEACVEGRCEACPFSACGDECCREGESCSAGRCCSPSCEGRECGGDGCGGSCGTCGEGVSCDPSGHCCVPRCDGRVCGGDGCGGSCGECPIDQFCVAGGSQCSADGGGYAHASRADGFLGPVLNLQGPLGVAAAGGHLLASNASGGSGFPRETPLSSSGTVTIPEGATVRHALLWVAGVIFMTPAENGQGDYTEDLGGPLDNEDDARENGVTFTLEGESFGPFDAGGRQPPRPSALGSEAQISPVYFDPSFGTLNGTKVSHWANRLDLTGIFEGRSGELAVTVNPPERLDVNGNDAMRNGGNPAGQTTHNLCSGGSSWSLLVVYERADLPEQNLVLLDGDFLRAWDYTFFHNGSWQRPAVQIDHAPIQPGARFFVYGTAGGPAGGPIPSSPLCSCGCGGTWTLSRSGFMQNDFFSSRYRDPPECTSDPMHRDSTNGPWYLANGGLSTPISGNDWTLFRSGDLLTEFPNLLEGEVAPGPDAVQPVTQEDDPNAAHDTYAGHPWGGRGTVTYHGWGNAVSVVEVELDPSRIRAGETFSHLFFRGDQKDVWKPQQIMMIKYILFMTPVG